MFKVTMQPMFPNHEPTVFHLDSEHELASFMIVYSSTSHCSVERWEP